MKKSKQVIGLFFLLVFSLLAALGIVHTRREWFEVSGDSMEPTCANGQRIQIDKAVYDKTTPKRFDVIVFELNGSFYIKRVIGLPGEIIHIRDGTVRINDTEIQDIVEEPMEEAGIAEERLYLGNQEYFVLGDNRNQSMDSRQQEIGIIKKEQIIGKAVLP